MSSLHLSKGSTQPQKVAGKLRLYSMEFCPYAHRARLVLLAKGVSHDVVNINLLNKPEWYFNIHPEGKVPALDTGDKVVVESLNIADYLDDQYPEPPLYQAREEERELISKIEPLTILFYKLVYGSEQKTPQQWLNEMTPHLDTFEEKLLQFPFVFFGGEKPGMVDYMLWPWGERTGVVALALGEKLPIAEGKYLKLRAWMKAMRRQPAVEAIFHTPERFYEISVAVKNGNIDAYNLP